MTPFNNKFNFLFSLVCLIAPLATSAAPIELSQATSLQSRGVGGLEPHLGHAPGTHLEVQLGQKGITHDKRGLEEIAHLPSRGLAEQSQMAELQPRLGYLPGIAMGWMASKSPGVKNAANKAGNKIKGAFNKRDFGGDGEDAFEERYVADLAADGNLEARQGKPGPNAKGTSEPAARRTPKPKDRRVMNKAHWNSYKQETFEKFHVKNAPHKRDLLEDEAHFEERDFLSDNVANADYDERDLAEDEADFEERDLLSDDVANADNEERDLFEDEADFDEREVTDLEADDEFEARQAPHPKGGRGMNKAEWAHYKDNLLGKMGVKHPVY